MTIRIQQAAPGAVEAMEGAAQSLRDGAALGYCLVLEMADGTVQRQLFPASSVEQTAGAMFASMIRALAQS
jgi:hypothetical protein